MNLGKINIYKDGKLVSSNVLKSGDNLNGIEIKGFFKKIKSIFNK